MPHTAFAADQRQELENLRSRISEMQHEMDQTNQFKSKAIDGLRESERAISNSNRHLTELSQQRRMTDQNLMALQTNQQHLSTSIQSQQRLLSKLIYLQYINGNQDYLRQFFDTQNLNQVTRNLQYYQYIARNRSTWLNDLRNNLAVLTTNSATMLEQKNALVSLSNEELAQQSTLNQEKHRRQEMLKKFSQQLRQQRREVNRLQRDENHLAKLVDKLSRLLAQPSSNSLFGNENLPDQHFEGTPFAQLKGKLILPVKGSISNKFGTTRADSHVLWKGLFLKSSTGQPVKVVAAGRVIFADWLRGFGNLLIVDHGMGYMSLYGNNETLFKQVGDLLAGGEVVASVGNTGGNEESGLYFELRHESEPFDPTHWLAKKLH